MQLDARVYSRCYFRAVRAPSAVAKLARMYQVSALDFVD
jgi:hypothetical protein